MAVSASGTLVWVSGRYGVSVAVAILSIIVSADLPPLSQTSTLLTVLGAIFFSTWYGGFGPGLFTTLISTIGASYYLIVPRYSLEINSRSDALQIMFFVAISVLVVIFVSSRELAQGRLKQAHEELGRLNARMEAVREEERGGLARELHDQIGGSLSILKRDVAPFRDY